MADARLAVVVTRRLPTEVETRLSELFDVSLRKDDAPMSRDALVAAVQSADVLVPTVTDKIDAPLLAQAGDRLKLIANLGAGGDNIDVATARQRGILVSNTPGVVTEDTADMTMALILAILRRIPEGLSVMQDAVWEGWAPTAHLGGRLAGRRLGLLGMGRIGPAVARGVPVVGLEPSCLLTFRDEMPALLGGEWTAEQAKQVMLFEEFIAARLDPEGGGFELPLAPLKASSALLHGHCHQKAFNAVAPIQEVLGLIPELEVELVNASCCGMAGSFGYQAETAEISRQMGELSLLPRVRSAGVDALIIADGTSCRHQIDEGAGRQAVHVARLLRESSDLALN